MTRVRAAASLAALATLLLLTGCRTFDAAAAAQQLGSFFGDLSRAGLAAFLL